MKDLSDNDFDKLLKQKAEAYDFDFDETAWNKMEQKLRRRDRVILVRNSSVVILLLMLCGGSYLFLRNDDPVNQQSKSRKSKPDSTSIVQTLPQGNNNDVTLAPVIDRKFQETPQSTHKKVPGPLTDITAHIPNDGATNNSLIRKEIAASFPDKDLTAISESPAVQSDSGISKPQTGAKPDSITLLTASAILDTGSTSGSSLRKRSKNTAFSFTVLAGPEFSSVESQGGKGSINVGLLLNASITKKLMLSSGLRYGMKNYRASASNYQSQNPSRAIYLSGIDASCNILEVPVQFSYAVINDANRKIQLTSGLSSYLMLKEKYNFSYTPESGYKEYLLVKENANQHYFGVLNLSASYQIKSKSSKVQWALEPFVKLPLGGVGEGNVRLKSSGVSLNLIYDLRKEN